MNERTTYKSPCVNCKIVEEPHKCTKKYCESWQMWFLKSWKKFNNFYNKYKGNKDG